MPQSLIPTPIGGTPLSKDLAPSIVFAVCYGLVAPLILYRIISAKSRTLILASSATFGLGQIATFAIRAAMAAQNQESRSYVHLLIYLQTTYASGYITMGISLIALLRCLLSNLAKRDDHGLDSGRNRSDVRLEVNDAMGDLEDIPETAPNAIAGIEVGKQQATTSVYPAKLEGLMVHASRRIVAISLIVSLQLYLAMGLGIASGSLYTSLPSTNSLGSIQPLRYASAALALGLLQVTAIAALAAWKANPHIPRTPVLFISGSACLLSIPAIYQLATTHFETSALQSTASGSLSSAGAKAAFYVFQSVPEFMFVVIVMSVNVREMFHTGPFGRG